MARPVAAQSLVVNSHLIKPSGGYLVNNTPETGYTSLKGAGSFSQDGGGTHFYPEIDWKLGELYASYATDYYMLYGYNPTVNWKTRTMYVYDDSATFNNYLTLDWGIRRLYAEDAEALNWGNRYLVGDWSAQDNFNVSASLSATSAGFADGRFGIDAANFTVLGRSYEMLLNVYDKTLYGGWLLDSVGTGLNAAVSRETLLTQGEHVFRTAIVNVKQTGRHLVTEAIPTGWMFCCDSYEFLCTSATTATGLSGLFTGAFGTHLNFTGFSTGHLISGGSAGARHIFQIPQDAFQGSPTGTYLAVNILRGSSGVAHNGLFAFKGHLIKL